VTPLSGFLVTFAQELVYFLYGNRTRWPIPLIREALGSLIQGMAYLLSPLDRSTHFTWMYLVVGQKR
jgi:hypothetical protein